MVLLTIIYFIM